MKLKTGIVDVGGGMRGICPARSYISAHHWVIG